MNRTKWPDGWLPIDTYNKRVDELAAPIYAYDWENLRKEVIANKGIRNSTLVAHMPTESSSKASGVPNGVYPVRGLYLKKTDGTNVSDWVANESDSIGHQYQLAYDIDTVEMVKPYAVIQKFTDQSISADYYVDRSINFEVPADKLLTHYLMMIKYGTKTRYYTNSLTTERDSGQERTVGCTGGSCTL
jgi:ribonucleoside-diphosphate reductase alpha chain